MPISKSPTTYRPSDPERPDWAILSKLLGRPLQPDPALSDQENATRLKALLFEAYGAKPKALITAAMHRRGQRQNSWLLKTFHDAKESPEKIDEIYETITLRLLMPEDGRDRAVSRRNQERERGSSYRILEYWDPQEMGVLPYLRYNIARVINQVAQEHREHRNIYALSGTLEDNAAVEDAREEARMANPSMAKESPETGPASIASQLESVMEDSERARELLPEELHKEAGRLVCELVASINSDAMTSDSPLHQEENRNILEEIGADMSLWRNVRGSIARPHAPETNGQNARRIALEIDVVRDLVDTLGGLANLPDDAAMAIAEDERIMGWDPALDGDAEYPESTLEVLSALESESEHSGVMQPTDKRQAEELSLPGLAYALSQARKRVVHLDMVKRPEYQLFGLLLGQDVTPAATPAQRYAQLGELANQVAAGKLEGLEETENKAIGVVIADEIAKWDPSKTTFAHQFPDALDHIEKQAAVAPENPEAAPDYTAPQQEDFTFISKGRRPGLPRANSLREALRVTPYLSRSTDMDVLGAEFWAADCRDKEELEASDRVDYRFLCRQQNEKPKESLAPAEVSQEVKRLATDWVASVGRGFGLPPKGSPNDNRFIGVFQAALEKEVAAYDPAEDGYFGECLKDFIEVTLEAEKAQAELAKEARAAERARRLLARDPEMGDGLSRCLRAPTIPELLKPELVAAAPNEMHF